MAGLIAIPLLLLWALTVASYEYGFVEKGYYATTSGSYVAGIDILSNEAAEGTPDITEEEAIDAAQELHPDALLVNVDLPLDDDPTSAYSKYFSDGYDPWAESEYPGETGVFVDRHTGVAQDYCGYPDEPLAQKIYEDFNYPVHSGYFVTGWWKIIWFVLGMSPSLLALTGVSTWLVRRMTRQARRPATAAGTAVAALPASLAEQLAEDPEQVPDLSAAIATRTADQTESRSPTSASI